MAGKSETKKGLMSELHDALVRATKLEAQVSRLTEDNAKLMARTAGAADLLKVLLQPCGRCQKPLMRLDWNSHCYIVCCNNVLCTAYRTPIGKLSKGEVEALIGPQRRNQE